MWCPCIYACVTSCFHSSKLKIVATVNRILQLLYLSVSYVCIIISFCLSLCPFTVNLAIYCLFGVHVCFMAIINLRPRMFDFLGILFSCTYAKALRSNKPLLSS